VKTTEKSYKVWLLIGIPLPLLVAWIFLMPWIMHQGNLHPVVIILFCAVVILSIKFRIEKAPHRAYMMIWGPSLLALLLVFAFKLWILYSTHEGGKIKREFDKAHPNIQEVHINLSGKNIWLDPDITVNDAKFSPADELRGNRAEKFINVTRYGRDYYGHDKMSAYSGARLAATFRNIPVYYGPPKSTSPQMMPVVMPSSYPDVSSFIHKLDYADTEAAVTSYQYYYYADRVEVVPALMLSGSAKFTLLENKIPFIEIHLSNLQVRSIVRLEINGQAIAFGDSAWETETANHYCTSRNYDVEMFDTFDAPLKVRWQLAEPNPKWREALVTVPAFKSAKAPMGNVRMNTALLYFQKDGSVLAEREQEIELANDQLAVRSVGPERPLLSTPPCGMASDRWQDKVIRLKE
jgi:hypothetical protein